MIGQHVNINWNDLGSQIIYISSIEFTPFLVVDRGLLNNIRNMEGELIWILSIRADILIELVHHHWFLKCNDSLLIAYWLSIFASINLDASIFGIQLKLNSICRDIGLRINEYMALNWMLTIESPRAGTEVNPDNTAIVVPDFSRFFLSVTHFYIYLSI